MSQQSDIEWTDATWQAKTAAARIGIDVQEYLALRRSGIKFCWRCRCWRSVDMFGADRSRSDGRTAICSSCRNRPRQLPLLRQTPAERDRQRYAKDPIYRAERRQHAHSRSRGVAPLPVEGIEALTEAFGGLCAYCPLPAATWDHLVPVSAGGRTVPGNIVPACVSCNSRKGARDLSDFLESAHVVVSSALENVIALGYEWGELQ